MCGSRTAPDTRAARSVDGDRGAFSGKGISEDLPRSAVRQIDLRSNFFLPGVWIASVFADRYGRDDRDAQCALCSSRLAPTLFPPCRRLRTIAEKPRS